MITFRTPIIIINFKTYPEATGSNALTLAKIAERVSLETGVSIGLAPQFTDIRIIAQSFSVPVFAQHIDPITLGSFTGHILPESIKEAGAIGTLINHSEKQLKLKDIKTAIMRAREVNLISAVCVANPEISSSIALLKPDLICIEPPELIGTGIPVSRVKPEIVSGTVQLVKQVNPQIVVLCGAGISKDEDVIIALKLGAQGVLVSSSIVKSKDPGKVLSAFADAIKESQNFSGRDALEG